MTEKQKRCFFVVGPESSGTRMMTQALILSGCFEDETWHNAHNTPNLGGTPDLIVFHRSLPHSPPSAGRVWSDILALRQLIESYGYQVQPILMVRDWHATIKSQTARDWFKEDPAANIQRAIQTVANQLPDFIPVTYEAFCLSEGFRHTLFTEYFKLPPSPIQIWYANDKYYPDFLWVLGTDEMEVNL